MEHSEGDADGGKIIHITTGNTHKPEYTRCISTEHTEEDEQPTCRPGSSSFFSPAG